MPPNMRLLQFIVLGTTGVVSGKKTKTKSGQRKQRAAMLMAMPKRPRDQRRGGRGCPRIRFKSTHEMETVYEHRRAEVLSVVIARSATVEPMLMNERTMVTTTVMQTALRGIFQPGLT
jgi:hypothetical protein